MKNGGDGLVVTDWDSSHEGLEAEREIAAGVNLLMAGDKKQQKAIVKALKNGTLDAETARKRGQIIIQMMLIHQDVLRKSQKTDKERV